MAFKWTSNWILQKKIKILTKFDKIFDRIWFFCIIKHFHPPSWRLSGPETGFCQKNIKIFAEKKPFLIFLSKFPEKKPGFWLNFRQYFKTYFHIFDIFSKIFRHIFDNIFTSGVRFFSKLSPRGGVFFKNFHLGGVFSEIFTSGVRNFEKWPKITQPRAREITQPLCFGGWKGADNLPWSHSNGFPKIFQKQEMSGMGV